MADITSSSQRPFRMADPGRRRRMNARHAPTKMPGASSEACFALAGHHQKDQTIESDG
ncbi:hypothetical protein [Tardiphaga sp.]|uniref:hypothetical protein n=1 Tax=Tardiphaga sp. TaxID=1926292 RepID=UPI00352BBF37